MKIESEGLKINQTNQQQENSLYKAEIKAQQSLVAGLRTDLTELIKQSNTTESVTPVDAQLYVLNTSINALQSLYSATVAVITSLKGRHDSLNKTVTYLQRQIEFRLHGFSQTLGNMTNSLQSLEKEVNKNSEGNLPY